MRPNTILTPVTAPLPAQEPTLAPVTAPLPAPEPTLTPATALLPAPEPTLAPATALLPEPTLTPSKAPLMRDQCGQKCRRKCTDKFSEERRKEIWNRYWDMEYTDRRAFMFHSVSQLPTAKLCVDGKTSRRGRSLIYWLKNEDQVPQQVCKTFFLATLGYHPANDSLVLSVMGKEIGNEVIPRDQKGRHTLANELDMQPVYDHIESFHPSVSHYQREHAPHLRYFPSDINIKLMYADYLEKGSSCSYESYCKAVKHKNISFAKLGEEECEECLLQDQHMKNDHDGDGHVMDCLQCQRWHGHKESAMQSRMTYQADAENDWPEDSSVRSVDLQKLIMLPRMPGLKTSIFTKRIVAFHETFASVGKKKK
ncbi:uncharacterized protein LOC127450385 [Myxocyprinus asiaticus]|uniref:uncharacterized protein LOC127450385 n=1 Tax=Myxocyprinus asiaticus TaxID=70543 RepID=UPI0022227710|nr:uncharacterized protein LOC127450385 [Myxocyprinus asiaticus]XP_051570433.1 uncharacterized protein LOC127450385 [Myxocyprinus asiaticus]